MIFIDGSNFYHGMKETFGKDAGIDFTKLIEKLVMWKFRPQDSYELKRTYYYNAPLKKEENEARYKDQQRFFDRLNHIPLFEIKLGRLEKRPDNTKVEKGVDIQIATDMIYFAFKDLYDIAILVSGDGDFTPAVARVKETGKQIINAFFPEGKSYHLLKECDYFLPLDESFLQDSLLKKRKK